MNATTLLSRIKAIRDMSGLTSRAGTVLLTGLCDTIGLTETLVRSLAVHSRSVRHDPGRVVRDIAVMIADGGDCLSDLHPGLRAAIARHFQCASWQRCQVHFDRGLLGSVAFKHREQLAADLA